MDTSPIYYVYIYLDTRKSKGNYVYEKYGYKFEFEYPPFYIGKGKNKQINVHLTETLENTCNKFKVGIINKIKKETNDKPVRFKYKKNLTEQEAFDLEIRMIKTIGRRNKREGPLTNLTNGGEGASGIIGIIRTEETKKKLSRMKVEYFKDPVNRERNRVEQIKCQNEEHVRSKKREKMNELWEGDFREKELERRKNSNWKLNKSIAAKKLWDNPKWREKTIKSRNLKMKENYRKVKINNEVYLSMADASRILNIPASTIKWRIDNKKEGYSYADNK